MMLDIICGLIQCLGKVGLMTCFVKTETDFVWTLVVKT